MKLTQAGYQGLSNMTDEKNSDDQNSSPGKRLLEQAYLLETPVDNIQYYDKLADTYNQDFAEGLGYVLPKAVAGIFHSRFKIDDSPVVDIGCGTGLLGKALGSTELVIDGIDISDAMLSHSRNTGIYRDLLNVDLTGDIAKFKNTYGAVLSSGTFTHGHLGPETLVQLLDMAKHNGLFVIAINQSHYESKGFDVTIQTLLKNRHIVELMSEQVGIYQRTGHAHSTDKGLVVSFRKSQVGFGSS